MKLLILGNGYDISLGYNTKYSDYIKSTKLLDNFFIEYIKHNSKTNLSWIDIENDITSIVTSINKLQSCVEYLSQYSIYIVARDKFVRTTQDKILLSLLVRNTKIPISIHGYSGKVEITSDNWFKELELEVLNEYHIFVNDFKNYIIKEFSRTPVSRMTKFANSLIRRWFRDADFVLNFNYSTTHNLYERETKALISNVHGKYQDNIVLGISEIQNLNSRFESRFYKLSQLLEYDILPSDFFSGSNMRIIPSNTLTVFIFGHSFGESDHYIFAELIDKYNKAEKPYNLPEFHIYLYDLDVKASYINNLRILLGQSLFMKLYHRGKIKFYFDKESIS